MPNLTTSEVQAIVLEIGGIPIRLLTDDSSFVRMAREAYGPYVGSGSDIDLTMDFISMDPDKISEEQNDVSVRKNDGRWLVERADFRLDWDPTARSGRISQVASIYALDTM